MQLPVVADEIPPCISHRAGLSLPPGWTWFWPLPTPLLLVFLKELPPDPSFGLHHQQQLNISQCRLSAKHQHETINNNCSLPRVRGGGPRSSTYSLSSCPCVCSGHMMLCLVLWFLCFLLTCAAPQEASDTGRLRGMFRTRMLRMIWSCSATAARVSLPRSALQPNP